MIHVCDAIMGSGKTQAAISFINENPEKKIVYITPYIDETKRINAACPGAKFRLPSDKIPEFKFSKLNHTASLLCMGENIATTHASFRMYTQDMLAAITENDYTLIVDEAVEGFSEVKFGMGDIQLLIDAGYIKKQDDGWEYTGVPYGGGKLADLFQMLKCNNIVIEQTPRGEDICYWALPKSVLIAFKDVYILTYLFDAQDLRYYLDISNLGYDYIGIHRDGDVYRFADSIDYVPDYVARLSEMIHIFENEKLNEIGKNKHALSDNWFNRCGQEGIDKLKNNLNNYLRNYMKAASNQIIWSSFKDKRIKLAGRGFKNRHVVFTTKATNEYRDKQILAYLVNVFLKPNKIHYFAKHGIEYDVDTYALSVMLQWIWRSAIRDGKEIWIYIPSSRMRKLLQDWITRTQEEYANRTKS